MRFTAQWPITDPTLSEIDLINEAITDLPNLVPKDVGLGNAKWTVEDGYVRVVALVLQGGKCQRGHELTAENIWQRPRRRGLHRECRRCGLDRMARKRAALSVKRAKMRATRDAVEKLPAEPLIAYVERNEVTVRRMNDATRRAYERAKQTGVISYVLADAICIKALRTHPALVFGDDWWLESEMDGEAA